MDLHQVEALDLQAAQGFFHLADAFGATARPHFGGEEGFWMRAGGGEQLAGHRLGATVHRRAVDHRATRAEQGLQHTGQALVFGAVGGDVEADVGAAADDG